ncbi:hypothetical protein GCM10025870_26850 [Agromyces marinus]|uniref:Uncharacterized protein n=1 Tax=Agromyces marinus TaxID=1389020 RepID=A0ABN6YDU8_9MICO|nr:hypothetical protein [Agromyces marinus]BDZ55612.1 hypothetical protein GCM10025870_26850 [Agromyces marinus]
MFRGEARIGSEPVDVLAIPVGDLPAAAPGAGSVLSAAVLDALGDGPRGAALEAGHPVRLEVSVTDPSGPRPGPAPARLHPPRR